MHADSFDRLPLTPLTRPQSWRAFRDVLEAALLLHGDDLPALVAEVERLTRDARDGGMRRAAFDAAIGDFVWAHDRSGLYPIAETTLANMLLAASRGFHTTATPPSGATARPLRAPVSKR